MDDILWHSIKILSFKTEKSLFAIYWSYFMSKAPSDFKLVFLKN